MEDINKYVGNRIKMFRKAKDLTLQQLADAICKSRSTMSKYENGEISIDLQTLCEIAETLEIHVNQLTNFAPNMPKSNLDEQKTGMSPFFMARKLYFYFYDGRYKRLKEGVINIGEKHPDSPKYNAQLTISVKSSNGKSSEIYYLGDVVYSDMLIRFSFVNQSNALEEDLLYIYNPLERTETTFGLLCGISTIDLMPCAFRCYVTLTPQPLDEQLKQRTLITKEELSKLKKVNMLVINNQN